MVVAHFCKGICDDLQFHYADTVFADWDNDRFWNPKISWENKYQINDQGVLTRPLKERFPGASTVFVAVTDAWHLLQTIQYFSIRIAIVLLVSMAKPRFNTLRLVLIFLAIWIIQSCGFHLAYTIL